MYWMFAETTDANPDVSKWDTLNVTNMNSMFVRAKKANPDVSKWNTSKVVDIENMFFSSNVVELDLSNWKLRDTQSSLGTMGLLKSSLVRSYLSLALR